MTGGFRSRVSSPFLAVTLLLSAACSTNSTGPQLAGLPDVIRECETNTARVCGVWTRNSGARTYSATWVPGSTATITALQWNGDAIEFERRDTGGPTPNMQARYIALREGNSVRFGQVRWTNDGLTIYGTWDATW